MYPTKKLGEIGIFNRGVTYNKGDLLENYQKGCVTLLRANNINDGLLLDDLQYLPGGFVKNDKILQKDDIIFCMSSGSKHLVGKNAIISDLDNFSFGAFCSMFRKNTNDDINYISYYFKSDLYKKYIFNFSQGVNILNLKNSDLENCEIPLPPLPTQKLIVQKLDSSFENINKQIDLIKTNLSSLEELNKSILEKVFSEGEFEKVEFGKIITLNYGKGVEKEDKNENGLFDVYGANGVMYKSNKFLFSGDSIIVGRKGSAGALTKVKGKFWASDVTYYVTIKGNYDLDYIYFGLKFLDIPRFAQGVKPGINRNHIYELQIPLPPLQKQKEIVSYLDEVFAKNKQLKTKYELQLKELEELKQSLLKDAFEGRLVKE